MYKLCWKIKIGKYAVKTLREVKIVTSVLNLADTAVITLPGKCLNNWKSIEDKIKVGDAVTIELGYNDSLQTEFKGYLKRIARDKNTITLECEDVLYLLNKTVTDKEYKQVSLKELLTDILGQVDKSFAIECDYDYTMEKLVVFHQTALDVLKKVHDETKANIWFDDKTLHVHPVYAEKADTQAVIYDTRINVQANELKWIDQADKKVEIEVVFNMPNGKQQKEKYGNTGGEKITKYVNGSNAADMKKAAESEYKLWNYSGYEGNFTGWLVPRVTAGGSVLLRDVDKGEGKYYVTGVEIEFGQSGAKRKISLGRQLFKTE